MTYTVCIRFDCLTPNPNRRELVNVQDAATPTGTFSYMAPEQFLEGQSTLTPAVDIYGLGTSFSFFFITLKPRVE